MVVYYQQIKIKTFTKLPQINKSKRNHRNKYHQQNCPEVSQTKTAKQK